MNDFGTLAYNIVKYKFREDQERFPISYVSGWLESSLGELNILIHQNFSLDAGGNVSPRSLTDEEETILDKMYELHYYVKASREALRSSLYPRVGENSMDWIMIKEGDTTIQRQSKTSISSAFSALARDTEEALRNLVYQYNMNASSARQVAGDDGISPFNAFDSYQDTDSYRRSI